MIADTGPSSAAPSLGTSRQRGSAGQHRWQSSGAGSRISAQGREMDVLISGPAYWPYERAPSARRMADMVVLAVEHDKRMDQFSCLR
jgi:hypothetical protein